jgi:hypothetical protein
MGHSHKIMPARLSGWILAGKMISAGMPAVIGWRVVSAGSSFSAVDGSQTVS